VSKEQSLTRILAAGAQIQMHLSYILAAKALEIGKTRNWACGHLLTETYENHKKQTQEPLKFHEQLVELLDGITKVENGLAKNLGIVLGETDADAMGGGGFSLDGLFDKDGGAG
jgi:hypothetical protein